MYQLTNFITLIRGPLALLFFFKNPFIRIAAILMALFTDIIDGYLARRFNQISKFGAILDPIMDKLFVYAALVTFYLEHNISIQHVLMMISRDICLFFVGIIFCFQYGLKNILFQAIRWGKITTGLQFAILFSLTLKINIHNTLYYIFPSMVPIILFELFVSQKTPSRDKI